MTVSPLVEKIHAFDVNEELGLFSQYSDWVTG
jgi:hypothetical protein